MDRDRRIDALLSGYGDGSDGSAPTAAQWRHLLERPADAPVSLLNFFKLRERAAYAGSEVPEDARASSGTDAFGRYSAVSGPALAGVGGRFLLVAPFDATFAGEDEDWDLVAIGSYPEPAAVVALFEDPAYREAFAHRRAACARQKVLLVG